MPAPPRTRAAPIRNPQPTSFHAARRRAPPNPPGYSLASAPPPALQSHQDPSGAPDAPSRQASDRETLQHRRTVSPVADRSDPWDRPPPRRGSIPVARAPRRVYERTQTPPVARRVPDPGTPPTH